MSAAEHSKRAKFLRNLTESMKSLQSLARVAVARRPQEAGDSTASPDNHPLAQNADRGALESMETTESTAHDLAEVSDETLAPPPRDRLGVIGDIVTVTAAWSIRIILLFIAGWAAWRALGFIWEGLLPILLSLVICTLLWVPTKWMRRAHFPRWLAALISVLGAMAIIVGLFTLIAPSAVEQSSTLGDEFIAGLRQLQKYVQGPPFNLNDSDLNNYVNEGITKIQESADQIIGGVVSGVSAVSSLAVKLGIVLMVTFFFLKDGDRFLPWLGRMTGRRGGDHLVEVLSRCWDTLGGFIRAQALVSLIDAVFIGAGLVILKVPLAMPLAILTFMGGFVPIVGAIVAGFVAVVVALVSKGFTTALIVLAIIIAVQQLEGNVLSPMLQSKAMNLHPAIVLLSVTVGSDLYGIVGAFLAVPVAATVAVCLRYFGELVDKRVDKRHEPVVAHKSQETTT